jgi:hypothetical protein
MASKLNADYFVKKLLKSKTPVDYVGNWFNMQGFLMNQTKYHLDILMRKMQQFSIK